MTTLRTETAQYGQTEIGTVYTLGPCGEHAFDAMGSSVHGLNVTGYLALAGRPGTCSLKRWNGATMFTARYEIVREYIGDYISDEMQALYFRLTRGRYIVGYSLGDGMLFRGELIDNATDDDAKRESIAQAEYWMERDSEDEQENEDNDGDTE